MFKFLGKIVSLPIRIVNIPLKIVEKLMDVEEKDRIASKPLDDVADAIEEAFDKDKEDR